MSNRFHNNPPLRYGMVGGGVTSQIGDSHRAALRRDSYFQLVAGAFDIDKAVSYTHLTLPTILLV